MAPITSADGPVLVTGAAGYIGAYVVKNLVEHGYTVRACVRDASRKDKTEYLLAMNGHGVGKVELVGADLTKDGAYDKACAGCSCVFHVAADLFHDRSYGNPFKKADDMYHMLVAGTKNVLSAIEKSGSVKRLIYTSSGAAVKGPAPKGYVWSEKDWCGVGGHEDMQKKWNGHFTNEKNPYGKGKMDCELMCYAWGKEKNVDVISIIPEHVLGPLMATAHNVGWQHDLGEIFCGRYHPDQLWGITDVRDCAEGYRLAAESKVASNGSRYFTITPALMGGAPTPPELVAQLRLLYPKEGGIGGTKPIPPGKQYMPVRTTKAQDELGLRYTFAQDTLRDTIDSLQSLGCIQEIRDKIAKKAAEAAAAKSKL
eukprot:gnl/TRDRNA2_/TRDRNA2_142882_c2_seq1.p1 gnl/TRDRNA2_/TRDRNA2_142882_c2~~gnl/TRDRNA2_/TRDRNA2_142882_c2_seq1.p1  ORF type:complete len:376 (+),score=78.38 gnl/TRDRNA2_/TRDRNA2_142882_c2_seq1:23-1129(+)